jgi:tetratricopeptide (TPR) repeat protein
MKTKKITLACLFSLCLSFALVAFAGGGGQMQYDLGVFAFDEGNFVAAENHFKKANQQEPDNPYYHHFLGKTYLKTKKSEEAVVALETAWKLNPDISFLRFDLATAYYEVGNYNKAVELLEDLVNKDPENVLARYYLGMSYFRQDKYGQALPPLLQAGEENKSIRDNSYYFAGISHFKFDEPDKALKKLKYVESKSTSEKLRHSARKWQEVIRTQQAKSAPYNLYLKLGMEYDDNVNLGPVNEDQFADEGDLGAKVYFSGKYKFVNTLNRKLGIGYTHYQIIYQDLSEFDLTAGMVSLFYQERLNRKLYFSFNYLPSHYWVDGVHYLLRNQLSPSLLYRLDDSKGLRFTYDFSDNDFFTDKDRSGQAHDFKVDFITMLFNKDGDLTVGGIYENSGARHPDYEYDLLRAHFEFSYTMPKEWKFILRGIWYRKDYDNIDSVFGDRRQDDKVSGALELLSQPIFYKWLQVQAIYYHTKNDSNIDAYSYKKNVVSLSLITKF